MKTHIIIYFLALILTSWAAENPLPKGFVMQVLEPTGGKIVRPKKWFYAEGHNKNSWMWTISKEDTKGGKDKYETGVRIQTFMGIQKLIDKKPSVFIDEFFQKKKAGDVHRIIKQQKIGLFQRVGIEVTEGDYRILYSLFWDDDLDLAVISIAGTHKKNWNDYTKIFDTMAAFELIDMSRFDKDNKKANKAE